ncbi:DUF7332 family protein [Halorubrum gandharaense]
MSHHPRSRFAAVALAALLLVALIATGPLAGGAGSVAAVEDGDGTADRSDRVGPITECFVGDGYPLAIGDPPATIDALVHVSVLTDRENGGEFGVELAGTLDDDPIITLAAGVQLNRIGLLTTGINPFAAFDLVYTYAFNLPMFEGHVDRTTYEEDSPPVGSAAGTVPC